MIKLTADQAEEFDPTAHGWKADILIRLSDFPEIMGRSMVWQRDAYTRGSERLVIEWSRDWTITALARNGRWIGALSWELLKQIMVNAMTYAGNQRESMGYNALMGVARLFDYESPYDDGLKNFGGMCDAFLAATGDLLYGDEVPPYPEHASQERMTKFLLSDRGDWPAAEYFDLVRHGQATTDDLKRAVAILRRYTRWAELAGHKDD